MTVDYYRVVSRHEIKGLATERWFYELSKSGLEDPDCRLVALVRGEGGEPHHLEDDGTVWTVLSLCEDVGPLPLLTGWNSHDAEVMVCGDGEDVLINAGDDPGHTPAGTQP